MIRASMAKAGRNDSCPCGSGKKFKRCCAAKQQGARVSKLMIAGLLAALAGGVYAVTVGFGEGSSVPLPGRVWSPEHGHYH
jgi:SEC-C motif